jgi:hypothetical protein
VLLCIEAATKLVVGYQPEDTYCRCCFVLSSEMYSAQEVDVADVAVTRAPAPRAHIPIDGGVLLLVVALPEFLFLVQFVPAWSGLFLPSLFFWSTVLASVASAHFLDGGVPTHLR